MKGIEIHLNGKHVATAGVMGDDGFVSFVVNWIFGGSRSNACLNSRVGGCDGATDERLEWLMPEIAIGDEITIKIVESGPVTPDPIRSGFDTDLVQR